MRPTNTKLRFDILSTIVERGDISSDKIKDLSHKHGCGVKNVDKIILILIHAGYIKRGIFLTHSGKTFFDGLKGEAQVTRRWNE